MEVLEKVGGQVTQLSQSSLQKMKVNVEADVARMQTVSFGYGEILTKCVILKATITCYGTQTNITLRQ